jgi:hypothetical protein
MVGCWGVFSLLILIRWYCTYMVYFSTYLLREGDINVTWSILFLPEGDIRISY